MFTEIRKCGGGGGEHKTLQIKVLNYKEHNRMLVTVEH